jgi:hypothetical protein
MSDDPGRPDPPAADDPAPDRPVEGLVPVGPDGVPVPIWAAPDRPRGLDAYFAPGGEDDAPQARRDDERRMLRLLVIFVAVLVGLPTILTLIGFLGEALSTH